MANRQERTGANPLLAERTPRPTLGPRNRRVDQRIASGRAGGPAIRHIFRSNVPRYDHQEPRRQSMATILRASFRRQLTLLQNADRSMFQAPQGSAARLLEESPKTAIGNAVGPPYNRLP